MCCYLPVNTSTLLCMCQTMTYIFNRFYHMSRRSFLIAGGWYCFGWLNHGITVLLECKKKIDKFVCNSPIFSIGQKRRVSFSVALLHKPDLIILDEPTVGVDPVLRERCFFHVGDNYINIVFKK